MAKKKTSHKTAGGKASAQAAPASKPQSKPASKPASKKAAPAAAAASRKTTAAKPAARRPATRAAPAPPPEPRAKVAKKSPYTKSQLHGMHDELLLRRARVLGDLNLMENEALREGTPEIDSDSVADLGSDAYERNLTLGLMEADARTLRQIDLALRAMDEGRYGLCDACSEPIPLARLEALPFATTCVPCQQIHENLR